MATRGGFGGCHLSSVLFPSPERTVRIERPDSARRGFRPGEHRGRVCAQWRQEKLSCLSIASGALSELETLVELAHQLGYMDEPEQLNAQVDDVAGLVMGLAASVRRRL